MVAGSLGKCSRLSRGCNEGSLFVRNRRVKWQAEMQTCDSRFGNAIRPYRSRVLANRRYPHRNDASAQAMHRNEHSRAREEARGPGEAPGGGSLGSYRANHIRADSAACTEASNSTPNSSANAQWSASIHATRPPPPPAAPIQCVQLDSDTQA